MKKETEKLFFTWFFFPEGDIH